MGLETGTFISDLTPSWPTASELKSQGDDHIRLIKAVSQGTFPNANKAFYFPVVEETSANIVLDATDMNNMVELDTSGGDLTVTLPGGLLTVDKGWACEIVKISDDANAVLVSAAAGDILTKVGEVASVRVGILCEPARFVWNGSAWRCHKPGPMIGSTESFDGADLPHGYLWDNGATFDADDFAELALVMGGNTLRDKRGLAEYGKDDMGGTSRNVLTAVVNGDTLGASYTIESLAISQANLPAVAPIFTGNAGVVSVTTLNTNIPINGQSTFQFGAGGIAAITGSIAANLQSTGNFTPTGTISNLGSGTAYNKLGPAIIVNKIKRAC